MATQHLKLTPTPVDLVDTLNLTRGDSYLVEYQGSRRRRRQPGGRGPRARLPAVRGGRHCAALPCRVGRDADSILLSTPVGEAVSVGIDADDGPPTAEAAEIPAGVDCRVGALELHTEDARATYPRRVDAGRQAESLRTLSWSGVLAGTLRAGPATVRALGPAVDPAALPPRATAADAGQSIRVSASGRYELYTPPGAAIHIGASASPAPRGGMLWVDTSDPTIPSSRRGAVRGTAWTTMKSTPALRCRRTRTSATPGS